MATTKTQKSNQDRVVAAVGKRPKSAGELAAKLGYDSHHGVSRALGKAVKEGQVAKNEKGYFKP
jgi:hypothetical protein